MPYHIKNVKSNDQLYRGNDFKLEISQKLMEVIKKFYEYLEKIKDEIIDGREKHTAELLLRIIATMGNNFVTKGVVNKILKLCLNAVGRNIKEVGEKKVKKRLVKNLKATVTDCGIRDNPKVGKLASQICSFFSKKKKKKN